MSRSKYRAGRRLPPRRKTGRISLPVVVIAGAISLFAFAVGMQIWNSTRDHENASSSEAGSPDSTSLPAGSVQIAGVEVLEPVSDAGQVPLNTPVEKQWTLRNRGTTPVTLGRATIKVLEGC